MSVTTLGAFFLVALILVLCLARGYLVWLLSAAVAFPNSAAVVVAGNGLSPFYVTAVAASAIGVVRTAQRVIERRLDFVPFGRAESALLALFVSYATLITVVGPRMFAGHPVLSPRISINAQLSRPTALTYTVSNTAQLAYLLLGAGVVLFIATVGHLHPRVLEAGIWAGLSVTMLNVACKLTGVPWPKALFDTFPTTYYQSGGRLRGAFAEPSILGAFLTASIAYLVVRVALTHGRARILAIGGVIVALLEYAMSGSGTALVGVVILAGAGMCFGLMRMVRTGVLRAGSLFPVALLGALAAVVFQDVLTRVTVGVLTQKLDSDSYADRSDADSFALRVLEQSYGFGVGLGSNRPSSFIYMMASCVGLLGLLAFIACISVTVVKTYWAGSGPRPTMWALVGIVVAISIAKADLATPILWLSLALCLRIAGARLGAVGASATRTDGSDLVPAAGSGLSTRSRATL